MNRLAVRGRPDLDPSKKSRHYKLFFSTLRHHLTDDWAFANEAEKLTRPWEYRGCEADITTTCSSFNKILYSNEDDEWSPVSNNVDDSEVKIQNYYVKILYVTN